MKENTGLTRPPPSLQLIHSHDVVLSAELFGVGGQRYLGVYGSQPVMA